VKFIILFNNIGTFILFKDETTSLNNYYGGTADSTRPTIRPVQNNYISVDTLFIFSNSISLTPLASIADTLALLPTLYGGGETSIFSFRFY
jgi:hypothetical protein